ncbi:MAG: S8/S53 family peptidase [Bacteroidia bacterium]
MKKLYMLTLSALVFLAACERNEIENQSKVSPSGDVLKQKANPAAVPEGAAFSKQKVDEIVIQTLEQRGDFHWEWVDLKTLWSAIQYGDQSVAIGYKPVGVGDITNMIHQIDISKDEWKSVHNALIDLIRTELEKEAGREVADSEFIIEDDKTLPIITIRLTSKEILTKLYNLENIRYIEPLDYWPEDPSRSSSGCGGSDEALNGSDYTTISPAARLPWNFPVVDIPDAWNISQGQGITIGVIDAGISSSQVLLNSQFNNGLSSVGRTVTTDYTFGGSAFASCSHGTSMSGLAVGPRNNLNASTGIAYKANLHFIRACEDVVLNKSSERTGVKNALVRMGARSDIKIISMSIGTPFSSGVLEDGVNYANNLGKLIFAAAGTSFSWTSWWGVIYPARYGACIAVTGVKENGSTCSTCHDGSQVVFTIPMERNSNSDRNTLSLDVSGYSPSYVGGSSSATAMTAGIAALVWGSKPNLNKSQVLSSMITTSQFYPSTSSSKGYGNINAEAAVNAAASY